MKTIFKIGSKSHTLKYQRKMSEGEVKKMKSFVTEKGEKLQKTNKFKINDILDSKDQKIYNIGIRGGACKPSTGYAFSFLIKQM